MNDKPPDDEVPGEFDPITRVFALGGLMVRRKQITRQIERAQYDIRKAITEVNALDAAIRSISPTSKMTPVKAPRAFCGQQRLILLALLETSAPQNNRQLALGVMRERGLPTEDLKLVRVFIQKTNLTLHAMRRQGEVVQIKSEDGRSHWRLPPPTDGEPKPCA